MFIQGYSSVEEDRVLTEDFNHLYQTDQTFDSRDAAIEWLRVVGDANNMYLVKSTTKTNRTYVKCHRGEKYRQTQTREGAKTRESSGSMRIKCPFQLVVERKKWNSMWGIRTMEHRGRHNHEIGVEKAGYRWPSSIKPHEYEMIRADTELGLTPVQILGRLKSQSTPNYSKKQHIYNARAKLKREKMGGVPPLGFLFKLLEDNEWYQRNRKIHGTNQIGDIFFGDSRSIALCEQFGQVLLVDATYKTNIWNLPLVEIIGFVPTGENYHVAFAFVHDEKEASYIWVMERLDEMLLDVVKPRIFVTDRELALMNAIGKVFPYATNLLCRRHIAVNVHKNFIDMTKSKDKEKMLTNYWDAIVFAKTQDEFQEAVWEFETDFKCVNENKFKDYVTKTWLLPYSDKFVACWVDQYMHYGALTTNML